jgi:hypothetical protein
MAIIHSLSPGFKNQVSGVGCQVSGERTEERKPKTLYEHHLLQKCSFFLIKLAAFQASGGWIKQRTAEYRISNRRTMKDGIAALCLLN